MRENVESSVVSSLDELLRIERKRAQEIEQARKLEHDRRERRTRSERKRHVELQQKRELREQRMREEEAARCRALEQAEHDQLVERERLEAARQLQQRRVELERQRSELELRLGAERERSRLRVLRRASLAAGALAALLLVGLGVLLAQERASFERQLTESAMQSERVLNRQRRVQQDLERELKVAREQASADRVRLAKLRTPLEGETSGTKNDNPESDGHKPRPVTDEVAKPPARVPDGAAPPPSSPSISCFDGDPMCSSLRSP